MYLEKLKLAELRSVYRPKLSATKFLNAEYFSDYSSFARYQDIPEKYFIKGCETYFFISHRWESPINPDPTGRQFRRFKSYFDKLPQPAREPFGFWYDFSCIPQKDSNGLRTKEEELEFAGALKILHLLATLSHTVILFTGDYLDRSWCWLQNDTAAYA
jgi:hypothetical protein